MAEGLALAASVVAVLQITNSVISVCYDYSCASKGASWELPRLKMELESLRSVLQQLEPLAKQAELAQAEPDTRRPAFSQLCNHDGPLHLCLSEVQKLEKQLKSPSWSEGFGPKRRALIQALRWPLKEKDTERALHRICKFRDILSFALNADQIALSLKIQDVLGSTYDAVVDSHQLLESVQRTTMDVQDKVNSTKDVTLNVRDQVRSMHTEARKKAIARWLAAPDPSTNYQRGCRSRHAATGAWFTTSDDFLHWKMDDNSSLWLHGKAGCGKTVLSSTIITEVVRLYNSTNGAALAYFFFDFNDAGKQHSDQMIRSIVMQLSSRSVAAQAQLDSLFAFCSDGQQQPDRESLLQLLQDISQGSVATYIIVDALDECSDLEDLLKVISEVKQWKLPTLHLLFTSRWLASIETTMRSFGKPEHIVAIQSALVDADISEYVSKRLQTDHKLEKWRNRPDIQEEVRSSLREGTGGMFRWAVCQLDALQKCPNVRSLRQAMRSMPRTLDDTYARMLSNIPNEYSEYAVTILRWLTHALRPVLLDELCDALAINIAGDPLFDDDARFSDANDLLDICSGLIEVDAEESTVRLAHFSVKEYLVSDRLISQKLHIYSLPETQSHELITASCLAYMLHLERDSHNNDTESSAYSPLCEYAWTMWAAHARITGPISCTLEPLIMDFFRRGSGAYASWLQTYPIGDFRHKPEGLPPLFTMAALGVDGIVQTLIDSGHDVNEQCTEGTALWAASACGRSSAVSLLLAHGSDPNLGGKQGNSPLVAAVRADRPEAVEVANYLVDSGADINRGGEHLVTPLLAACTYREAHKEGKWRYEIVLFLLKKGANVHARSKLYGTALHVACARPRAKLELVEALVSGGAEVDALGGRYGTALQAACAHHGNDKVIGFLLTKADPSLQVPDSKYGTALQAVCAESHDNVEIVKLLLEHGAPRNVYGGKYGTAIQAAGRRKNLGIVKHLMESGAGGAEVDAEGGKMALRAE